MINKITLLAFKKGLPTDISINHLKPPKQSWKFVQAA